MKRVIVMSEEEFKEISDYLDRRLIICNAVKEPINKDLDCAVKLSVAYEKLKQRVNKAKELCKIVLDNEDKNKDLLERISVIYRELQSKE